MKEKIELQLDDSDVRQALSEWVTNHTRYALEGYARVIPSETKPSTGTAGFPTVVLEVKLRRG